MEWGFWKRSKGESSKGRKRKLSLEEELLAVFMRLLLGLLLEDMADRLERNCF